jgi:N utilization substance protein B
MISRRILRIKILQILYTYFQSDESSLNKSEKELFFSIQKTYDLYHYLFLLVIELADYANSRIDIARQKKIPTREDLNPNTKFVDNFIIRQLRANKQLNQYISKTGLTWTNSPELIKKLYHRIQSAPYFRQYLEEDQRSYEEDKKVIMEIYSSEIINLESLYQTLEEQSIYWNDEVEFVVSMNVKTLKGFRENDGENAFLMPLFKNEDDREFARDLFRKAILHKEEYRELVKSFTENWDVERIAFMDFIILQAAIAEAVEFSSIPTRVTINEYLEIAKFYSTERSSLFINGLLDKIFRHLKEEGKIVKAGRGLIGEE